MLMNDSPRLLILANTLVLGGSERIALELARGLPAYGYHVTIATLSQPGEMAEEACEQQMDFYCNIAPNSKSPRAYIAIKKFLEQTNPDLIYVLDHENAIFWARILGKKLGIPVITAFHSTRLWGGKPSLGLLTRRMCGYDARHIAVAEGQKEYLVRDLGLQRNKICVIYNGIDLSKFNWAIPYEHEELGLPCGDYIGVVAALRPEKNLCMVIRAFAHIAEKNPNYHLVIVGEGVERTRLEQLICDLELKNRIFMPGFIKDVERVYPLFRFVALSSYQVVETLPLCLLEAGACGLASVATKVGSVDEIIIDGVTGILVGAEDENAMTEAFSTLLGDSKSRKTMGVAARERIASVFNLTNMLVGHDTLFRSIINKQSI